MYLQFYNSILIFKFPNFFRFRQIAENQYAKSFSACHYDHTLMVTEVISKTILIKLTCKLTELTWHEIITFLCIFRMAVRSYMY